MQIKVLTPLHLRDFVICLTFLKNFPSCEYKSCKSPFNTKFLFYAQKDIDSLIFWNTGKYFDTSLIASMFD